MLDIPGDLEEGTCGKGLKGCDKDRVPVDVCADPCFLEQWIVQEGMTLGDY